jgi:hypothetical protein
MTEASMSLAGNLTDDPEVRYTEGGIARAMFRVAVSGRREQEPSFFTVIVWRDQAELIWAPLVDLGVCESGDVGGVALFILHRGEPA